jgi:hypothetical protein
MGAVRSGFGGLRANRERVSRRVEGRVGNRRRRASDADLGDTARAKRAENVVLRRQLIMLRRKVRGRVRLTNGDRLFLVRLYRDGFHRC